MSREVFQIIQEMNGEKAELQLVLQCAPVLSGLKISNLLIIDEHLSEMVIHIVRVTNLSLYGLVYTGSKVSFLLYKDKALRDYLFQTDVKKMLNKIGYRNMDMDKALRILSERYRCYMEKRGDFPHEIGLFLGYPVEDVKGFIKNKGKNCLCTGYWKVYGNMEEKTELFEQFDYVRALMVMLIYHGAGIPDIIDIFNEKKRI